MKRLLAVILIVMLGSLLCAQTEPSWLWAKSAGNSVYDCGSDTETDAAGNVYVTGWFCDTVQFGNVTLISAGGDDIFVAKLDTAGNWLWISQAGGNYSDDAYGISIDAAGNSYISGSFKGTAHFGATTLTSVGGNDVFAAKLDPAGNWLWAVRGGGSADDCSRGISTDAYGNSSITGYFAATAVFGTTTCSSFGHTDVFVARLSGDGNWLWTKQAWGMDYEYSRGVTTDSSGNSYITGDFGDTIGFGGVSLSSIGSKDIFVAKLDQGGNWLWAKRAGGTDIDSSNGIDCDAAGNVYLTGTFFYIARFGSVTITSMGNSDAFIAKLDTGGNWLWAKRAGGSLMDEGFGICCTAGGTCYVTGYFSGQAYIGYDSLYSLGYNDIFVAQLAANGNWLNVAQAGGTGADSGHGVACDNGGTCYASGGFSATAGFDSTELTSLGETDIYIARLSFGTVGNDDDLIPGIAEQSCLYDAYPNPLRRGETAFVKVDIPQRETGTLSIFNLRGELINRWELASGEHRVSLDSSKLSAGIYLYQLKTGSAITVKKLVVLK